MKIGRWILLCTCVAGLCFLIGMFVGRNIRTDYAMLPQNSAADAISVSERTDDLRLDINTATQVQLMELPGIGEVLAERIILYRETVGSFQTTDDLLNVEGIGQSKLQTIVELIKVGG